MWLSLRPFARVKVRVRVDNLKHSHSEVAMKRDKSQTALQEPSIPEFDTTREGLLPPYTGSQSLEHIRDAFLSIDHDWRITFANRPAVKLFGVSADEMLGRVVWDVFPAFEGSEFQDAAVRAIGERVGITLEAEYQPLGLWLENRVYPTTDGMMAFYRDITESKHALESIRQSEAKYRRVAESGVIGIYTWNMDGRVTWANDLFLSLTGYTTADIEAGAVRWDDMTPPDWRWTTDKIVRRLNEFGAFNKIEKEYYRKDGSRLAVIVGGALLDNKQQGISFIVDISEWRRTEAALVESEYRLRLALHSGKLGSIHIDLKTGQHIEASDSFKAHFGFKPGDYTDDEMYRAAIHPDDRERIAETRRSSIESHTEYDVEYRAIWPDGSVHWIAGHGCPIYDDGGQVVRLVGITQDITERKLKETRSEAALQEAQARADQDPLTGLLNHRAFQHGFQDAVNASRFDGSTLAVVMLDLDNFKFFNDIYGHAVGDDVLIQVAQRLRAACRRDDKLSRFGGDEFAVLLTDIGTAREAEITARLLDSLGGLAYLPPSQETPIPITVSLGIAFLPVDGNDRTDVLRIADDRLRRAKTGQTTDNEAEHIRTVTKQNVEGFSMLDALVTAVDNKDRYTRKHSEDVMTYSLMIGRALKMSDDELQTIGAAALLHDVGKIGVPDAILRKPGALTDAEFAAVKQHPEMGAIMVSAVHGLEETLNAIRYHHERWDGKGYPIGLKDEQIPLTARLMAVADAYSAMTTDRPYRQGMPQDIALAILEKGAGIQWDPVCVRLFVEAKRAQ